MPVMFVYPAIFRQEENAWWAEFPDLEGCHAQGSSPVEAAEAAQEALCAYLVMLWEQGNPIPSPADIRTLQPEDGFASLVFCDLRRYKDTRTVQITVTIPAWLNDRTEALGLDFSKILQDAMIAQLFR